MLMHAYIFGYTLLICIICTFGHEHNIFICRNVVVAVYSHQVGIIVYQLCRNSLISQVK